jgi:hypothetical protein
MPRPKPSSSKRNQLAAIPEDEAGDVRVFRTSTSSVCLSHISSFCVVRRIIIAVNLSVSSSLALALILESHHYDSLATSLFLLCFLPVFRRRRIGDYANARQSH